MRNLSNLNKEAKAFTTRINQRSKKGFIPESRKQIIILKLKALQGEENYQGFISWQDFKTKEKGQDIILLTKTDEGVYEYVLTSKSGFGKLIDKKKLKMPKTLFLTQYNIKNGDEKAGIQRNKLYKLSDKILADLNISKDEKFTFLL